MRVLDSDIDKFKLVLEQMRSSFLEELPERCDLIEQLICSLEGKYRKDIFDNIYRHVHSLKGSGGTHGVSMVTTVCHQLENRLSEYQKSVKNQDINLLLSYVDLLRDVANLERRDIRDFSSIEKKLLELQIPLNDIKCSILLAESSGMMKSLYENVLSPLPAQITFVDDGLSALNYLIKEDFDVFIVAGELKFLNGVSVSLALRASESKNKNIKIILITSRAQSVPDYAEIDYILPRNVNLVERLASVTYKLISI